MSQAWIETFTGVPFDILEPKPEMIKIEDIAHALSMLCRFTGHTKFLYTVGQHSLVGSYLVPPDFALDFLLHDATEAYIGDMNRPLKHYTEAGDAYRKVEANLSVAIARKFGISEVEPECVRKADDAMLYAEKQQLMTGLSWTGTVWSDFSRAAHVVIREVSPKQIEQFFLDRFYQLKGEKDAVSGHCISDDSL